MNMVRSKSFIFLFIAVSCSLFLSCEKDPSTEKASADPPISQRKVLVELFTGHKDGHGAIAAEKIRLVDNNHAGKVIWTTVHSGFFAEPAVAPYTTDLHTDEGDVYHDFFNVTFNPVVTVSRTGYPGTVLKPYSGSWDNQVDSLMNIPPDVSITIANHYNSSTRVLSTSVTCRFLKGLSATYKLAVLLTEDSVVAAQRDYSQTPNDQPSYPHRHVLRDGITTAWGELLPASEKGDSIVRNYVYNLPVNFNGVVPRAYQCSVVAYVYNTITYEVLQAEEKKIE